MSTGRTGVEIGPDYIVETLDVPSAIADKMKTIPRRFNETLSDWADRVRLGYAVTIGTGYSVLPSPQATVGEKLTTHHHS